jgi:prepilin-type N-terminal cleavage/methylation domain-containing protein
MKQKGVSFLEVIVVIGILLIVSAFVSPSITNWRSKRSLESDYLALLSNIDFLKTRVRTMNGTGVLICSTTARLTYQISSNPQSSTSVVSANFSSNVLEDPSAKDVNFNILSGESTVVSALCTSGRGIFVSSGMAGLEGGGGAIDIELNRGGNRSAYGAYRVLVNQTSGFVQKYKWIQASNAWVEQD